MVCEHDILQTACGDFTKFTTKVIWRQGWTIRFWGQKVKAQGHSETTYGQVRTLEGIFLPVFGMLPCISVKLTAVTQY